MIGIKIYDYEFSKIRLQLFLFIQFDIKSNVSRKSIKIVLIELQTRYKIIIQKLTNVRINMKDLKMEAFLWFIIIGWIIYMLITYWPVAIGTLVLVLVVLIVNKKRHNKEEISRYNFNKDINSMDGFEFERYVAELLKHNDYTNVKVTQASGDHGIDVIADKNGLRYGIQCKRYSFTVGNSAIHEAYSGSAFYDCDKAIVVTNNKFTKSAREEAKKLGVILWDGDYLYEIINSVASEKDSFNIDKSASEDTKENIDVFAIVECPNCNVKIRVKKTNGKMLAIRCTRCNYSFLERT